MKTKILFLSFLLIGNLHADKAIVISEPQTVKRVAIIIPETITIITPGNPTFSDTRSHIVQSIVERAFLEAKYKISILTSQTDTNLAANLQNEPDVSNLIKVAGEKNVDYLIVGQATAHILQGGTTEGGAFASKNMAKKELSAFNASNQSCGAGGSVSDLMASAEVTAKIISVKDGEIIAIEEAFAGKDGLSEKAMAHGALREAGSIIAARLIARASLLFEK
jgi:hypothetical protein